MNRQSSLLCFAMKSEAAPVLRALARSGAMAGFTVRTVGMGPKNAEAGIRHAFATAPPGVVLTCGLAGGLAPDLSVGDIVFETEDPALAQRLQSLGIRPGRFHCSHRIACLATEKARLRGSTGADAVEMESGAIQAVCKERGVPCATVRIISDAVDEDMPVDFNALAKENGDLDRGKLVWTMARSPATVLALLRFRSVMERASASLSTFLVERLLPELQKP